MSGNGTATGVGGSSEPTVSSTPIIGETVGWDRSGVLVELSKAMVALTVQSAIH